MERKRSGRRRPTLERLESRHLLAGVTLLTHGFAGNVDGWISTLADAAATRLAPADAIRYEVEVTDPGHDGGPLTVRQVARSGPSPTATGSADPEILILLDWSDVAGSFSLGSYSRPTGDVAHAVADALVQSDLIAELPVPVASLPLHLAGHSRGGSLVGALAGSLGRYGVWVDQVTTWDPHPVDGVSDPLGFDFGDAPMVAWENVAFWDNYWRTDGPNSFDFTGEPIAGTFDLQLSEGVLASAGYSNEHSDVHLWYHGTVDTSGPISDGSATVAADAGWYNGNMGPRDQAGYFFSRAAGGARPAAGIPQSLGGTAQRSSVGGGGDDTWPTVVNVAVTSPAIRIVGQTIEVTYNWRDRATPAEVQWHLDTDANPLNGLGQPLASPRTLGTSATIVAGSDTLITTGVAPGNYHLVARVRDGDNERYVYAPDSLELTALPTIAIDDDRVAGNVSGADIGRLSASDENEAIRYTWSVQDDRFEVDDNRLKLRAGVSLPGDSSSTVSVPVTAARHPGLQVTAELTIGVDQNLRPWHNADNRLDISNDGLLTPVDALAIINELNNRKYVDDRGRLPAARPATASFLDASGDGFAAPNDALGVINALNARHDGGEGEATAAGPRDRAADALVLTGIQIDVHLLDAVYDTVGSVDGVRDPFDDFGQFGKRANHFMGAGGAELFGDLLIPLFAFGRVQRFEFLDA